MKSIRSLFMLLLMGCAGRACAQASSTASSNATIVAPISMTKNVDMNFGTAAVSTGTGGKVILAPAGMRTTAGGGVTLPSTTGTVTAASFTVAGAPGYTYSISLPSSAVISGPGCSYYDSQFIHQHTIGNRYIKRRWYPVTQCWRYA